MTILYLLIPLGLMLVAIAVWAFFWAVSSGQFDDLSSPAWSVVMDDDAAPDVKGSGGPDEGDRANSRCDSR